MSQEKKARIRALARKGWSYSQITSAVGSSCTRVGLIVRDERGPGRFTVLDWDPGPGRLSQADRDEISVGLERGESFSVIAARVGRAVSTISREVSANGGRAVYRASFAHRRAYELARRPKPAKLAVSGELRGLVEEWLEAWWSPEQIARRLRDEFPDDPMMRVSHETIYQSLFVQGRGALRRELTRCLRSGRAQRRSQGRVKRGGIVGLVSISERPAEVEDRAVPGHWEGDLIIGKNGESAIATLVERSTRYVLLARVADQTAETVREAITAQILTLPEHLRRSLTWDRGKEMSQHLAFTVATDINVYFCDPHSPWQRGSNENTNGLLRQYFPKGTDLSTHSQEQLNAAAASLNNRPRKTLDWKKPSEKLTELLATTT